MNEIITNVVFIEAVLLCISLFCTFLYYLMDRGYCHKWTDWIIAFGYCELVGNVIIFLILFICMCALVLGIK